MDIMSRDVALKFCDLCNWVYESWVTHKALFDENKTPEINIGKSLDFTSDYKMHDNRGAIVSNGAIHEAVLAVLAVN